MAQRADRHVLNSKKTKNWPAPGITRDRDRPLSSNSPAREATSAAIAGGMRAFYDAEART